MNCKKVHRNLIFFLEKELPVPEMELFQQHLDACPGCALFAAEMAKTLSILERDKITDKNPFFFTRLKERLETQREESLGIKPVLIRVLQPVAFSILLLCGIYGGFKLGQPEKTELATNALEESQMIMYLNEMEVEPIETFLME